MKTKGIMHIFTRTPLHVGAGNSVGVVDSPIQRERHTRFPIIPGSSLKGVLADLWNDDANITIVEKKDKNEKEYFRIEKSDIEELFGSNTKEAKVGNLLIGEAKILAFPVRSAKGAFAWITCPLALARYERDSGIKLNVELFDGMTDSQCYGSEDVQLKDNVVLEEYNFKSENLCEDLSFQLSKLFEDKIWETVATRLVVVNDEIFAYFVENACEVVTRICVDDESGVVKKGALFNQEQVPSESMFYAPIREQKEKDSYSKFKKKLDDNHRVIQVGGNETIGLGFCSVSFSDIENEV